MSEAVINNAFYDELDERWYKSDGHIIGLLRAESVQKTVYVREVFEREGLSKDAKILDIGCGAGLISNRLAEDGYELHGIDQSAQSIEVAKRHIPSRGNCHYVAGDAFALPYEDQTFDSVMLLDFLEHVERPDLAIKEAARVLKPGGIMLFYTFNRTWIAGLLAAKAVQIVARDCPKNFHLLSMFIKPKELEAYQKEAGVTTKEFRGLKPVVLHWPFWASVFQRRVHPDFSFEFTKSLQLGYLGYGVAGTK